MKSSLFLSFGSSHDLGSSCVFNYVASSLWYVSEQTNYRKADTYEQKIGWKINIWTTNRQEIGTTQEARANEGCVVAQAPFPQGWSKNIRQQAAPRRGSKMVGSAASYVLHSKQIDTIKSGFSCSHYRQSCSCIVMSITVKGTRYLVPPGTPSV